MMMKSRSKQVLPCPHCGKGDHDVDALPVGREVGPWYCKVCGLAFSLVRLPEDGTFEVTLRPETRKVETLDLLMLPPQDQAVYFVVKGMRFEDKKADPYVTDKEHKAYYYDEHSCPTNWLAPEMVYYEGDSDPHGLIRFVATKDLSEFPPDEAHGPNDHDAAVEAFIEQATAPLSKT